jgi:isoleucyl-tRNA synthetase
MGTSMHGEWKRIPDVFDCWFESGSMPFGSNHYPFNKKEFDPNKWFGLAPRGYPADFIAEGLDQTRGWFYSLMVLGVALFGRSPYKNVIVNGLVLASDGQKMSKRLKNYPDPMEMVNKYGADALRYYLLSSQLLRGEDLRLQEKGIDEVSKKILMRLDNVRSFYGLYAEAEQKLPEKGEMYTTPTPFTGTFPAPEHVLDRWILARLAEMVRLATAGYEHYELDEATRPLGDFIDDLSTWYIRRSRDRFKGEGKEQALHTLRHVLSVTARTMAPVMPFFAESLFQAVRMPNDVASVHLAAWPALGELHPDPALLSSMREVRSISSKGLELRERAGIKIRQPLASLTASNLPQDAALRDIIADEVNVKEVKDGGDVSLDTELTPQLKEEGILRTLVRRVQEWRKEQKLTITDRPELDLDVTDEERPVAEKYRTKIMKDTNLTDLRFK